MSHINSDTLEVFKSIHQKIHYLLKEYHEKQTITDEQLVEALSDVKDTCSEMVDNWNDYLGI